MTVIFRNFCLIVFLFSVVFSGTDVFAQKEEAKKAVENIEEIDTDLNKKEIKINSQTLEIKKQEGSVFFKGNVIVEEDFILCSDELKVFIEDLPVNDEKGEAKKQVTRIEATGNVKVLNQGKVARGDHAIYEKATRLVTITGNSGMKSCGDFINAPQVIVDIDNQTIRLAGEGDDEDSKEKKRVKITLDNLKQQNCKEEEEKLLGKSGKDFCQKPEEEL